MESSSKEVVVNIASKTTISQTVGLHLDTVNACICDLAKKGWIKRIKGSRKYVISKHFEP